MNTRWLFAISLIVAVFAVWFYRSQGEIEINLPMTQTDIEYQADNLFAIQTNESGMAEYALVADSLTHYAKDNRDTLHDVTLNWRTSPDKKMVVNADDATIYHEQQKIVMTDNVVLLNERSTATHLPLTLQATQLIGDLAQKRIYSDEPVQVSQGDNTFEAASFVTDAVTGDSEFDQVAITFMPPNRQDVALF